jgi:hypothetical protein
MRSPFDYHYYADIEAANKFERAASELIIHKEIIALRNSLESLITEIHISPNYWDSVAAAEQLHNLNLDCTRLSAILSRCQY